MKLNKTTAIASIIVAATSITPSLAASEEYATNKEDLLDSQVNSELNINQDSESNTTGNNIDSEIYNTEEVYSKVRSTASRKDNVKKTFKAFYIYGPTSNPTIDLSNKTSLIKTYSQANDLLKTSKNGKKTDRQKYLDAWKALTSKEKSSSDMKKINTSYNNIVTISNGAKSVLKFYEDVVAKRDTLIKSPSAANKLNSKSNTSLGARGKAYNDYTKASKIESKSSSPRVAYINEKYLDGVYFLNVAKYIEEKNQSKAVSELAKIKDTTLKETAQLAIDEKFMTKKQEDVVKKFKTFYLYGPASNPNIDLTKKDSLITKYSQAEGLLKTTVDGVDYDRQKFLNAYNSLSANEKNHSKMKEIKADYDNMIIILEAAQSVLKFYEDVKANAADLIKNPEKSAALNSKGNLELGARGKAYNDYTKASKIEPAKSSKRVSTLNKKYCDTLYFLNIAGYISSKDEAKALETLQKISDSTLKKVALNAIYDAQGNDFVITPDSPTFKNNMMSRPSFNEYTKHYYLVRSYLEELDARGGGTLTLKGGTFNITNSLYIPSNTTIILDGATLKKSNKTGTTSLNPAKSILQTISPSNNAAGVKFGGYNGEENIKIIGKNNGAIDLGFTEDAVGIVIGHCNTIEVSGINFKNMYGGHFIELDGSKNVTIKSNSFKGSKAYGNYTKEAINIDTPDKLTQGWDSNWTKYDKTPNLNVYIENNSFSGLDRAIGTHKYSEGKYHTNIQVRNNLISNTRSDAIRIMNWKDTIIESNVISDIDTDYTPKGRAILGSGVINPTIKNNSFEWMPRPMQFYPDKNKGAGSEYAITYNQISEQNKIDFRTNQIVGLEEEFIRINEEYNIFEGAERIYLY